MPPHPQEKRTKEKKYSFMSDTPKLPKKMGKTRGQRVIEAIPAHLKDPANYEKIERAILDAGATRHSHAEIIDWHKCVSCQQKQLDRLNMMKKLGFQSAAHYLVWKKVHQEIKTRDPLTKWK